MSRDRVRLPALALFVAGLAACGQQGTLRNPVIFTSGDAGMDMDVATSTRADTGTPQDTGPAVDVGPVDTGPDSGMPPVDTGVRDAGRMDAMADTGPVDTGPLPDAGQLPAFTERLIDDTIQHGQGVEIADIDRDNNADVVVALSLTDAIRIYKNNGMGASFTAVTISSSPIVGVHVTVADLDNDMDLDVAAVGLFARATGLGSPGEVAWFKNPGMLAPGTPWSQRSVSGAAGLIGARYIDAADFNGDNVADLVVSTITASGPGVVWYLNSGDGEQWTGPSDVDPALTEAYTVIAHDVDNDTVQDVISASKDGNEVAWYENTRMPMMRMDNLTFTKHSIAQVRSPFGLALANLDADAAMELVVSSDDNMGGALQYYDPPADPTMPWTRRVIDAAFGGGDNARLVAADFNRDGRVDVAIASQRTSEVRIYYHLSNGAWVPSTVTSGLNGLTNMGGGDLNGDMNPDLVTTTYENRSNPVADRLAWWRNMR